MSDDLLLRQHIIQAAIQLEADGQGDATMLDIAQAAGVSVDDFLEQFASSHDVLPAFYPLTLDVYEAARADIDGYSQFSTEEKAATLVFTLFDQFDANRSFVQASFDRYVWDGAWSSTFRRRLRGYIDAFLEEAPVPPVNGWIARQTGLPDIASWATLGVIRYWIGDESPQQESSLALVDRLIAFFAAIAQFQGPDEGVALVKYLVNIGVLPLDRLPFVGAYFETEPDGR